MRNYTVTTFLILSLITSGLTCSAQDSVNIFHAGKPPVPKDNFWHRVTIGGNFGFQFGSVTGIMISPEVRIRAIDQLYVGIGFTYQYFNYKDYYWNDSTKTYINYAANVFGGRIYLRYYLRSIFSNWLGNIFAHAEYEYLAYIEPYHYDPYKGYIYDPYNNKLSPGKTSISYNSILVGAGYSQPLGGRVFMDILILFNLNNSYYSPYTNPVFRIGVGVGL